MNTDIETLVVSQKDFVFFIEKNQITFCQSDNCYTSIHLSDGRSLLLVKSLSKIMREDLNSSDFIRVNQSFLVNRKYIKLIDKKKKHLELKNDQRVPFTVGIKELLEMINIQAI